MTTLRDTLDSDEYDEFGMLSENAAEWDITFTGQPVQSPKQHKIEPALGCVHEHPLELGAVTR